MAQPGEKGPSVSFPRQSRVPPATRPLSLEPMLSILQSSFKGGESAGPLSEGRAQGREEAGRPGPPNRFHPNIEAAAQEPLYGHRTTASSPGGGASMG